MRYSVYLKKGTENGGSIVQVYAQDCVEALVEALRTVEREKKIPLAKVGQEYVARIEFNPDPNEKEGQIAEVQQRRETQSPTLFGLWQKAARYFDRLRGRKG